MSKHRFLTHSFATDVATRSLAHRALSRALTVAFVGASLMALAACGSTAADIATKEAAEAARRAALEEAELSAPTPRPEDPGSVELGIMTPHSNEGTTSQTGNVNGFTATGLTITGKTGEARGVSENPDLPQDPVTGYTFADLEMRRFSPTPIGSQQSNDVPFLLIWQFADANTEGGKGGQKFNDIIDEKYDINGSPTTQQTAQAAEEKTKGNGKFIAPGIGLFRYNDPDNSEFDNDAAPPSRAAYLERMLDDFKPSLKGVIDGDPDKTELEDATTRPLPYTAGLDTNYDNLPGSHVSRVFLSGSSSFWGDNVDVAASKEGDEADATRDGEIPAYDVELIFPKRYATDWALQYSGFILMRAFYTGGSLATGAPQTYINLFTYTRSNAQTSMGPYLRNFFDEGGAGAGKSEAKAEYTSLFSGWGVAAENPNLHTYLYDSDFILTATFVKGGGGKIEGKFKPNMRTTGGTTVGKRSKLEGSGTWHDRTIELKDVKWTGYNAEFTGTVKVLDADGEAVSAYDSYRHLATVLSDPTKVPGLTDAQRTLLELTPQELAAAQNQVQAQRKALEEALSANYNNFKGKFAGPKAEELVAEMKLQSSENDEPTVIGGVSGHRYDYANLE
jgi:hypothetical protein